ncbi:MAG TPA: ATP-binding protein, partial [Pyrinomonadaceae bacterium]|nr:ATP-binding protein [Pyrinomonadaceae bacterium]
SAVDQRVHLHADVTSEMLLRLQIEDSGPPLADLASVFDPEESSGAREADINELGILIGHRLLEALSGKVTLQHRDEGGLRILMQLPARPARA